MKTQAAVLWGTGQDWKIEDVDLDPPQQNEVLLKLTASGLCHSDEHLVTGDLRVENFPYIGGHEGAGIVEEVGPGVTSLAVGDHVVLGFIPSCGRCPSCSTGHQNLCDLGALILAGWQPGDNTSRHHVGGKDAALMCCIGTFEPYTVVNEASVIKIDDDIPLDKAALVGCGVTTGFGSAVYAAETGPGQTVLVVGCGGIGVNAIQGARISGAKNIVAIDPVAFKREQAEVFGATQTAPSVEEALPMVTDLTRGAMADKAIVTVGVVHGSEMAPIMASISKNGRCVVTGLASSTDVDVSMSLLDLTLYQKQLVGSIFGSANPRFDIPRLLGLYRAGQLKLDELVTKTYDLADVNTGYQDMRDGKNVRGMVMFDQ
jgi:S-(hydroxymethyl)glutathione dehydrogenase/alcohol dehydrogenase